MDIDVSPKEKVNYLHAAIEENDMPGSKKSKIECDRQKNKKKVVEGHFISRSKEYKIKNSPKKTRM